MLVFVGTFSMIMNIKPAPQKALAYPLLEPGDVVVDQSLVGPQAPYYADLSSGLAALSSTGGTLYLYPGVYRELTQMEKSGRYTIQGVGEPEQIIITSASEIDESKLVPDPRDPSVYVASLVDLGITTENFGVVDLTSERFLRQVNGFYAAEYPVSPSEYLTSVGCADGFAVENGNLYIRLSGNSAPTSHALEISRSGDLSVAPLKVSGMTGNVYLRNLTFRGIGGSGTVLISTPATASPEVSLVAEHLNLSVSATVFFYLYTARHILDLTDVYIAPNHALNYRLPSSLLVKSNSGDLTVPVHIMVNDSQLGPNARLIDTILSNPQSTIDVNGIKLLGTCGEEDHIGIKLDTSNTEAGVVTVKNSIFASWDYNTNEVPYAPACRGADGNDDQAHDFFFAPADNIIHQRYENNLFAYAYGFVGKASPPAGSSISLINNIFINGQQGASPNYNVLNWDYNLYYNSLGHSPGSYFLVFPDDKAASNIEQTQQYFAEIGCPSCESHGINEAPQLFDWDRDNLMSYDFTPTPEGNLCGTGKDGADIGPIPCAGNQPPELTPINSKTIHEQEVLTFNVLASDDDSEDTLVLSASNLPAGATFTDNGGGSGAFSWTPTDQQASTYPNVHFEVTDGTDTDTEDITITVLDGAADCTPAWDCSDWSVCADSIQTRSCHDNYNCGSDAGRPVESAECDSTEPAVVTDLQIG
jgi:hypothetical protein